MWASLRWRSGDERHDGCQLKKPLRAPGAEGYGLIKLPHNLLSGSEGRGITAMCSYPKRGLLLVNIYAFEESFVGRCREILKGLNTGSFEIICVINWGNKRSGIIIWVTEGPPFLRVTLSAFFVRNGHPREPHVNRSQ